MKEETRMKENSFDLLIEAEHFDDQGGCCWNLIDSSARSDEFITLNTTL